MGEPYIKLYDWMLDISGLSICDALAYAIVYGYTERGQAYKGTSSSLSRRLRCSERSARRSIHVLIEMGLIVKTEDGLTAQKRAKNGQNCPQNGQNCPQERTKLTADTDKTVRTSGQNCPQNGQNCPRPFNIEYSICNQGSNQDSIHPRTGPTEDEIKQFCLKKGLTHVDPAAFFAHYEARDWRTETGPVRNWQKLVAKWDEDAKVKAKANAGRSYAITADDLEQVERIKARMAGYEYQEPTDELPF